MTQPRKARPRDAIERRILDLKAAKTRHANLTRMARLEREVAPRRTRERPRPANSPAGLPKRSSTTF
ncbi:MAG TPA: hypothetical protein VN157_13940 [Caulobacter sp.]|nr:hypothetical protein [Caulobacter sp.]